MSTSHTKLTPEQGAELVVAVLGALVAEKGLDEKALRALLLERLFDAPAAAPHAVAKPASGAKADPKKAEAIEVGKAALADSVAGLNPGFQFTKDAAHALQDLDRLPQDEALNVLRTQLGIIKSRTPGSNPANKRADQGLRDLNAKLVGSKAPAVAAPAPKADKGHDAAHDAAKGKDPAHAGEHSGVQSQGHEKGKGTDEGHAAAKH